VHNEFRELLHSAEGQSRRVVVVFLDVRGFSSFAGIAESTDTAEFLKSVYIKILDQYFPDAEFFKPTGDGLLILLGYDRDNLTEVVRNAIDKSVQLVKAFPAFCDDDDMVNFDVPGLIGVGLARGSATSLTAGTKVLDYSGRPLNLASRLMDLARPSGIVFDDSFGYGLLDEEAQELFDQDTAYVKSIAESLPMRVYCLKGYTEIPEHNKKPMDGFKRITESPEELTFAELEERAPFYRHSLTHEPARKDNIELHLEYPAVKLNGRKHPSLMYVATLSAEYGAAAGSSYATVDYARKVAELKERGIKGPWGLKAVIEYSVTETDAK
jgi:class 3 adenylate cyclase